MKNDFNILIEKLNRFIRKYYKNQILKGLIYSLSIILVLFLVVDGIEYFAWTSILARTVLFYSFMLIVVGVLVYYILIPGFKLASIGKTISRKQAANIIGKHFPEVSDKLLNTLQLKELSENKENQGEVQLLEASIEQKASTLNPIPFRKAIDLGKNVNHLKYFVPPLLLLFVILLVSPAFITEPSARLVNHSVHFEKPLPYQLTILNEKLEVLQHDNYKVRIKADGEEIPLRIKINDGRFTYSMQETKPGFFEYTFNDVNQDIHFTIQTGSFQSSRYHLKVLPKPIIFSFNIILDYPSYLNRKNDLVTNSGDVIVPEGTTLKWNIFTKDTKEIVFRVDDLPNVLTAEEGNVYRFEKKADQNFFYTLTPENEFVVSDDSMSFSVQVIRDEYPTIDVEEYREESMYGFANYNGNVSDDYGFRSLKLFYRKENAGESTWNSSDLKINPSLTQQNFYYSLQASDYNLLPGESITYYFEIRDNDAINGFKRTKSSTFYLHLPDQSELEDDIDETSEKIKEQLREAMAALERVNKEIEEARVSMFEKKDLNWMDKKQLSDLINKEKELQNTIEELNQLQEEMSEIEEMLDKSTDEQLEERLNQLDKLFEEMQNEELSKQLEEMQKELENLNKEQLSEYLEKIKQENDQLKGSLEQNLELYKQLEFEKKLQETVENLKKLSEEQKNLAKETKEKSVSEEKSLEEQEEIKEDFSKIEEDIKKTEELNSELEDPFDVKADSEKMDEVKEEMNDASESLESGKQKKAAESQSNAGEKMEQMANDLAMMMQSAMQSRMGEDIEQIKKLLDNLLDLSFKQELLMAEVRETSQNDPSYIDNIEELKLLQDDFQIVHDSLIAVSKRQVMVQPFILKESDKVNYYVQRALNSLQERVVGSALGEQQYAMTSMNNLALMLAESLDKMQQSMQMSGSGGGQTCPNPGTGKPANLETLSKMQQELNKGIQEGKKGEEGTGSNGEDGEDGKDGNKLNSEELARMAAAQSEIRRQLQQFIEQLESEGGSGNALNKLVEDMKKSEEDMVNRRITQETLERQKQIEVRLLQSEKAELEREKKKKREAVAGVKKNRSNFTNQNEYKKQRELQEEILIAAPIEMTPFYRALFNKYLYKLQQDND